MVRLGILGLDTSHGEAFGSLLASRERLDLSHVWDTGTVRDDAYVTAFCSEHDASRVETPAAMLDQVDAVMILTVDWERHVPLASLFLEADIPVLVDKPIAGSASHLETLTDTVAASDGTLFGGSAIPFHEVLAALPADVATRTVFGVGYDHPVYYGAHLTDVVRRLGGSDWRRIEPLEGAGDAVRVEFENGAFAILRLDGPAEPPAFGFLDVADRIRTVYVPGTERAFSDIYDRYFDAFVETIAGERDDGALLIDATWLLLGMTIARREERTVTPVDEALDAVEIDSQPFVSAYEPYY